MAITIAGKQFSTRKPRDLDAALIAVTGCNAEENLRIVSGVPMPGLIAGAILPFLGESAPHRADLARMIEQDLASEGSSIVEDVKRLFIAADVEPQEGE